jgi:ADP-ribose pyrophosphatase YjhB (NUDIX family)
MGKKRLRTIAIGLFHRADGALLVNEGHDAVKGEPFYRPPGGGIEFQERGAHAVRRELLEELGAETCDLQYLGTVENLFTFQGEPRHEIVMAYGGRLRDAALYDAESIPRRDKPGRRAVWMPVEAFRARRARLYPAGILPLLEAETKP